MSFPWAKNYEPQLPLMKWVDEKLPLPRLVYNAIGAGYPVPRNLNYFWNFGVLAGAALMIQIITGIVLAMHYAANADMAFNSVEHIMRSEEHTSELQSQRRISYAVFCLKKNKTQQPFYDNTFKVQILTHVHR